MQRRQHLGPTRTAQIVGDRRPDDVDLFDLQPGREGFDAGRQRREVGRTRCPPDPDDAAAVRTQGDPQRGAFRAAADHVLAAPQHAYRFARLFGQRRRQGRDRTVTLPAEGAPVGQRRRGLAAGSTPAGIGLHVGRFDPGRRQRQRPRTVCGCHGVRQRHRAVAPLDPSHPEPRGADVGRDRSVCTKLHQRIGRCGVVGEATRAQDDVGSRGLERRALELRPPTGQQRVAPLGLDSAVIRRFLVRARRAPRRRSIANPYSDRDGPAGPLRLLGAPQRRNRADLAPDCPPRPVEHGQPHQDPGRAETTLARAVGHERVGPPGALLLGETLRVS